MTTKKTRRAKPRVPVRLPPFTLNERIHKACAALEKLCDAAKEAELFCAHATLAATPSVAESLRWERSKTTLDLGIATVAEYIAQLAESRDLSVGVRPTWDFAGKAR